MKVLDLVRRAWPRRRPASPARDAAPDIDRSSMVDFVRALQRADEEDRRHRSDAAD
jgi:hypothetical protein